MRAVAIELDGVLGDTRPLWRDWLEDAARRFRSIAPLDPDALPKDRADAAEELDRWAEAGVGDWRDSLRRFAEDRAPVYLRPNAEVSAALRALAANVDGAWESSPTRPKPWRRLRWHNLERSDASKPSKPAPARSNDCTSDSGPRRSSSGAQPSLRSTIQGVKEKEVATASSTRCSSDWTR